MKVGYTGTQRGMTGAQKRQLREALGKLLHDTTSRAEFHHGDCVGGDEEAHAIARELGLWMVGHPPISNSKRAFCDFDEVRAPKGYLSRNHDIVDEADVLVAAPKESSEVLRSGTWATIRYARKTKGEPIILSKEP